MRKQGKRIRVNNICRFVFLALAVLASAVGCGASKKEEEQAVHLAVILGAHANAPRANTSLIYDSVLEACGQSGSSISLIVNDGAPYASVVDIPETKAGLSREKYRSIAEDRARQILELADQMLARTGESDLLSAAALAARHLNAEEGGRKELVILDSGLTTVPPLDFTESTLDGIQTEQILDALEEQDAVPDLKGIESVCFYNLGDVAQPQSRITEGDRKRLTEIWKGIFDRAGAEQVEFRTDLPLSAVYAEGEVPAVSVMPVVEQASALVWEEIDLDELDAVSFGEETIAFLPDTDELVDREAAKKVLEGVAGYMKEHPQFQAMLVGTTAKTGDLESCISLSGKRAEAVRELLMEQGIDGTRLETAGTGYENPFYINDQKDGALDETAAAKNRSVILLDASGDMASQIRGHGYLVRGQ